MIHFAETCFWNRCNLSKLHLVRLNWLEVLIKHAIPETTSNIKVHMNEQSKFWYLSGKRLRGKHAFYGQPFDYLILNIAFVICAADQRTNLFKKDEYPKYNILQHTEYKIINYYSIAIIQYFLLEMVKYLFERWQHLQPQIYYKNY